MTSFFQVTPSKETLLAWQNRPQRVVCQYIKTILSSSNGDIPASKESQSLNRIHSYEDEAQQPETGEAMKRLNRVSERFRSDSLNMA
jgi:hypothetical protein